MEVIWGDDQSRKLFKEPILKLFFIGVLSYINKTPFKRYIVMSNHDAIIALVEKNEEKKVRDILNSPGGSTHLKAVIIKLASIGNHLFLLELIANTRFYPEALQAAAKQGHFDLVSKLIATLSGDKKDALTYVLQGASEGGHFDQMARLLLQNDDLNPMVCLNALSPEGQLNKQDLDLLLQAIDDNSLKEKITHLVEQQFEIESTPALRS